MSIFNNKYRFNNLKYLNDLQKLKIIGFLIIITVFTWFLLIYSKISVQIDKNTILLQQLNAKNALIEKSANKCIKLDKKIADINSEINCSNNKDIKKEITNYAKETGLALKSYLLIKTNANIEPIIQSVAQEAISTNMGLKIKTAQQIQQDTVLYEFTGKIDQIIAFCHKLNLSKSCFECQEINISKKNELESIVRCTIKLVNKQHKATS